MNSAFQINRNEYVEVFRFRHLFAQRKDIYTIRIKFTWIQSQARAHTAHTHAKEKDRQRIPFGIYEFMVHVASLTSHWCIIFLWSRIQIEWRIWSSSFFFSLFISLDRFRWNQKHSRIHSRHFEILNYIWCDCNLSASFTQCFMRQKKNTHTHSSFFFYFGWFGRSASNGKR